MNISEMSIPDLLDFLQSTIKEVDKKGHEWADAKATYEDLEDKRKSVLGQLMSQTEGSQSYKEQIALCASTYLNHLKGTSEARSYSCIAKSVMTFLN